MQNLSNEDEEKSIGELLDASEPIKFTDSEEMVKALNDAVREQNH